MPELKSTLYKRQCKRDGCSGQFFFKKKHCGEPSVGKTSWISIQIETLHQTVQMFPPHVTQLGLGVSLWTQCQGLFSCAWSWFFENIVKRQFLLDSTFPTPSCERRYSPSQEGVQDTALRSCAKNVLRRSRHQQDTTDLWIRTLRKRWATYLQSQFV